MRCGWLAPELFDDRLLLVADAIDITAALARCAISLTEAPAPFGLASAGRRRCGGERGDLRRRRLRRIFRLRASASLGGSASFGASTGFASFDRMAMLGKLGSFGASALLRRLRRPAPCGAAAAKRSSNNSDRARRNRHRCGNHRRRFGQRGKYVVDDGAGFALRPQPAGSTGVSKLTAELRINAGAENIGIDGPRATQHQACDRRASENMVRNAFTG